MLFDLEYKFLMETGFAAARKANEAGWLPYLTGSREYRPQSDEITAALSRIRSDGEISILAVFSAQTILNIHSILGPKVTKVYEDLRYRGAVAEKFLDIEWSRDKRYKKN
ncbi:hypothetical protein WAI453_013490 [Rhynchosporium graminicola]|uniref:Uncharacterized protein n=1 Tax=Rhynchosporium graminicola TaxID=2792576 RepID=A0A1E1K9X9_9HELO|nr:uncharacterized protein RCO7_14335 [Rhynchosporium commune]